MNRLLSGSLILFAGLVAVTPTPGAEDRGLLDERFTVSAGTFLLSTSTRLSANGSVSDLRPVPDIATAVDLEQDLGLRPGNRFRVDANWRIAGRHHVRVVYFDYAAEATRSISRELTIRDTVFPVSASVTASFGTQILEAAYEYALVQRNSWDLLGTIGAHLLRFDFAASGDARSVGEALREGAESVSTEAPLPVVGLRYLWRMSPRWYLETQSQYFRASIDGYSGHIIDLRAGVNWMFSRHLGVGAGYSRFETNVDVDRRRFTGTLKWRYSGAQVYVIGSF